MTRRDWPRQGEQAFRAHDRVMAQRAMLQDAPTPLLIAELARRYPGQRVAVVSPDGHLIEVVSVEERDGRD